MFRLTVKVRLSVRAHADPKHRWIRYLPRRCCILSVSSFQNHGKGFFSGTHTVGREQKTQSGPVITKYQAFFGLFRLESTFVPLKSPPIVKGQAVAVFL